MDAQGRGDAWAAVPTPRVPDAVLKVCSPRVPTRSLLLVPPPAAVSQARGSPLWLRPLLPCGPSTPACSHQPRLLGGRPWGPADQRQSLASPALDTQMELTNTLILIFPTNTSWKSPSFATSLLPQGIGSEMAAGRKEIRAEDYPFWFAPAGAVGVQVTAQE